MLPNTTASKYANDESGITEIVLSAHSSCHGRSLVMPMLAHLSHCNKSKWFTWITPKSLSKNHLASFGFANRNVRLVHTHSDTKSLWVFWDALANGNSSTVVVDLNYLSEQDRKKLERAARLGQTRGLVLRRRYA